MTNDYQNHEGCWLPVATSVQSTEAPTEAGAETPDPTAGEALFRITAEEKNALRVFRPIVYISSPYSGNVEANVSAARRYSRFAVDQGYIPIAPHLLFPQFLNDNNETERNLGLFFGSALMSKCAEVWVFGSRISAGMEAEIKRARWKDYRLRYFTEECQEV